MPVVKILCAVGVSAALAPAAHASFVDIRDPVGGVSPTNGPDGLYLQDTPADVNVSLEGGNNRRLTTGVFDLEIDFRDGAGFQPLLTYCIQPGFDVELDVAATLPGDAMQFELVPLESVAGWTAAEVDLAGILWDNAFNLSLTSELNAAAFQVILWELEQDAAIDFDTGDFLLKTVPGFSDSARQLALQWIDNINTGVWTSSRPLFGLVNGDSQNFVIDIPTPGTASLLALAALAAAGSSRRRHA